MFRVDSEDSVASLPTPAAAGTPGYYSEGDPGLGIQATVVPFDHLNAIQESIIDPIEKRGITLSKTAPYDKLTEAIQSFVAESGNVSGLVLDLTSQVLSLLGADGNALSSSNFGFVPAKSTVNGKKIALKIATPISATFDVLGSGDFQGIPMGINGAADWTGVPWFIYSINKSNNPISDTDGQSAIGFSRNPMMHVTPASTYIGKKNSAPSTPDDRNVLLCGSNYTVANYGGLPARLIGGFYASWNTAFDDWFAGNLGVLDVGGLGLDALQTMYAARWAIAVGQGGANASSHFSTGGTVPSWTTGANVESYYEISPARGVRCVGTTRNAGAILSNGSGGQALGVQIPFVARGETTGARHFPIGWRRTNATESVMLGSIALNNANMNMFLDSGTAIANTAFTNSADDLSWDFTYNPF